MRFPLYKFCSSLSSYINLTKEMLLPVPPQSFRAGEEKNRETKEMELYLAKILPFKRHFPLYNHLQSNSLSLKKLSKERRDHMKSTKHLMRKKKKSTSFLFLFFSSLFLKT